MTNETYDHDRAQADLGVLVLGALDPAEREAVEAHVAGCPECAATVAELAPLPGLLKRVDTSTLDLGAPPPELLERALTQARAEDAARTHADDLATDASGDVVDGVVDGVVDLAARRKNWKVATTAAVAALLTAAAVILGFVVFNNASGGVSHSHPVAASKVVSGTDPSTGVSARVVMAPAPTGTALTVSVQGVEQGDRCSLVAITHDGQRDVTSTWTVMYRHGVKINTGTSFRIKQIAKFEVTTPEGDTLVSLPVQS